MAFSKEAEENYQRILSEARAHNATMWMPYFVDDEDKVHMIPFDPCGKDGCPWCKDALGTAMYYINEFKKE
jgi:hypothetical protein